MFMYALRTYHCYNTNVTQCFNMSHFFNSRTDLKIFYCENKTKSFTASTLTMKNIEKL